MSPFRFQCSLDHHIVLQSKNNVNSDKMEPSCFVFIQGLIDMGTSFVLVNLRDLSYTHSRMQRNALVDALVHNISHMQPIKTFSHSK